MNHHYELDWLYGWMVGDRAKLLGNCRSFFLSHTPLSLSQSGSFFISLFSQALSVSIDIYSSVVRVRGHMCIDGALVQWSVCYLRKFFLNLFESPPLYVSFFLFISLFRYLCFLLSLSFTLFLSIFLSISSSLCFSFSFSVSLSRKKKPLNCFIFRVYVKKMLQYVPIIGWAWKLSDVVFLERNWEKVSRII